MPAWQARRVAQQTHAPPLLGARWVDHQLASRTDGALGPVITDRLVALADREVRPRGARAARGRRHRRLRRQDQPPRPHPYSGTSDLAASGDTLTLQAFHDLVCAIAHQLFLDGDTDPLGVRKIKAIALITALATGPGRPRSQSARHCSTKQAGKVKVYVRVDADDLDLDAQAVPRSPPAGRTPRRRHHGQAPRLGRPPPGRDPARAEHAAQGRRRPPRPTPVDARAVILRDGHCIFPRCTVDARPCDLDHEIPYDPEEAAHPARPTPTDSRAYAGAPPRQDRRLWRYARTPEGHYLWHGPHGATYLVTDTGTHRVG